MGLQYSDDDDLFDNNDDEYDESTPPKQTTNTTTNPVTIKQNNPPKRRLRTRPMSPAMMQKHPEVVSILLTRIDGRQLVFVRN